MIVSAPTRGRHSDLSSRLSEDPDSRRTPSETADCQMPDTDQHMSKSSNQINGSAMRVISFGPFSLLPDQRQLLEVDKLLNIGSRAFDILLALVESPGQLISKEELMARVWPNVYVEPANLTVHVAALRRVLGDGREGHRYLVNIPGRGYRFVAPVSLEEREAPRVPPQKLPRHTHNLPNQITRLVGRAEASRSLATFLSNDRLLTIVGPGGIGKTSVALAVADELTNNYEHGVWLVDLARINDPQLLTGALGSVLGLDSSLDTKLSALVELLREKQTLLVFDNCEHVAEAAASLAESILRGCSGVRILATSREPLRAEGERRFRLSSLEVPPTSAPLTAAEAMHFSAVELFVERTAARLDGFDLSDLDAPIVVDLCRKLDGNPLAIEFAVGRIDTFGVRGLSTRLDGGLRLLTGGYRTALPRHQTLRAMLDWSFDWLPESERVVLSRLSIFTGEFVLEAAIAVASSDDIASVEVADAVVSLVEKSLVNADISGKEPQYRLLEITRDYAHEKLQESFEFGLVARRHAEYVQRIGDVSMVKAKDDADGPAANHHIQKPL
jgi:predicted ATPase/DNA-binding winged helix-turn-helix (wHTH) protein